MLPCSYRVSSRRMKALLLVTATHVLVFSFVTSISVPKPSHHQSPVMPPQLIEQVRKASKAMATTTQSTSNISQAHQACEQWNELMNCSDQLPQNVRGICFALHASCLARVGQDTMALESYQACLDLKPHLAKDTIHDATMGRAFALQRLMKYNDAHLAFLECDTEGACIGAVTCLLRLSDVNGAQKQLRHFLKRHPSNAEVQGMLGTLLWMQATTHNEQSVAARLLEGSRHKSPLYQWTHWMANKQQIHPSVNSHIRNFEFLELASVNQSPFDDPLLIHLDDKVLLHDLLTNIMLTQSVTTSSFWPIGFVVPRDLSIVNEHVTGTLGGAEKKEWILKQRTGYGSHGNQLLSDRQVLDLLDKPMDESYLCQQLVSPPLLLNGYKFTVRIYVVYFSGCSKTDAQAYLAKEGLVKLASVPFDANTVDDENRVHMTNSGREDEMRQYNLAVLKDEFEKAGWSYSDFWNDIRKAVHGVMHTYLNLCKQEPQMAVGNLCIPKIMGFDFMADATRRPFLLEVNRFPGLEPRDANDSSVKRAAVYGAWTIAGKRLGLDTEEIYPAIVDADAERCSFERIL